MSDVALGDRFTRWAKCVSSIQALVVIGSRTRTANAPDAADAYSDWDFQVVTRRPELFEKSRWLDEAGFGKPHTYVMRGGRLGTARKVTALLPDGEIDLVIIPTAHLSVLRWLWRLGLSERFESVRRPILDLGSVLRGGFHIEKGAAEWGDFFRALAAEGADRGLSDDAIRTLADGFVCDYVSTIKKIERGELIAAQRWLHHYLAETNLKLLQELRRRRTQANYPDARRLEAITTDLEIATVRVAAEPTQLSLRNAVRKSAATCRKLLAELVNDEWCWPAGIE